MSSKDPPVASTVVDLPRAAPASPPPAASPVEPAAPVPAPAIRPLSRGALRHFEIDGNSWTAEPKETASLTCSPQELAQNAQFWASEADKLTPGNTATVITPAWIARYMCTNRGCMDLDRAWPRAAGASLADQDVHRLPPGNRLIESDDLAGGFFIEKDIGGRRAIISDSGAPFRSKEDALRAAIDHPSNRAQGGTTTYQP